MSARRTGTWLLAITTLVAAGLTVAQEENTPDLDFLEYLGSWEEAEEDWVLLTDGAEPGEEEEDRAKEGDPAPDGEKMAELDDEK